MKEIKLVAPSGRSLLFTDGSDQAQEDKLVVLVWGVEHSGKSRLGVTGPEVAGIIPTDRKTRFSAIKTSTELGTKILLPKVDFVREAVKGIRSGWEATEKTDAEADPIIKETKKKYRTHINEIKDTAWAMYDHPDVQLLMIDSFEQFYVDLKFAYYGRKGHIIKKMNTKDMFKDTTDADQELQDFVDSLSGKHLVLTHRNKAEYVNDKATGRDLWSGFKHLGFKCNLQVEMVLNKKYDPNSDKEECQYHYGLNIVKSLHRPELEGEAGQLVLMDDLITFSNLKELVLG